MILTAPQTAMWEAAREAVRPRVRVRPSAWAEQNIILTREQSPGRPGPLRHDYVPWGRAVHDCLHDHPGKRGVVCVKYAQAAFTRSVLDLIACTADTDPCPILYVISDRGQAAHFVDEHFMPVVKGNARLSALFAESAQERRELLCEKPFRGGRLDVAGGGSAGGVASRPYVLVCLDEYELIEQNFPPRFGSPWVFALGRQQAPGVAERARLLAWSHPTLPDSGIWALYESISDQRPWVFDCPRAGCGAPVYPLLECIHFRGSRVVELGDEQRVSADPSKAVFVCPACGGEIADAERARALWPPILGGNGRFESVLPAAEAERRDYVGLHITGLANPRASVTGLAAEMLRLATDEERQTFHNVKGGEAKRPARTPVTADLVASRIRAAGSVVLPGGNLGVAFVTAGVDVQAPAEDPTLYLGVFGWDARGHCHAAAYEKLKGWLALYEFLRTFGVKRLDPLTGREDTLTVRVCAIDYGYETGRVLDACRRTLTHGASHALITLLPVKYQPHVKADHPAVRPPEHKRVDPARPHLGAIPMWWLHRHTWVERAMGRWRDGAISVLCPPPDELAAHATANALEPVRDVHGWEPGRMEFVLQKGRRDDFLQAQAYAEAAAVLECNLNLLRDAATRPVSGTPASEEYTRGRLAGTGARVAGRR